MSTVRVKICGITRGEDARAAAAEGVDALGFVFARSPRRITPEKAREIIDSLPAFVSTVGVFVDEDPERVRDILDFCGLDYAQFHGDEGPEICNRFGRRAIKAVRVESRDSLEGLGEYLVAAFLLDSHADEARGGTGKAFDWGLAPAAPSFGAPVILAGGLTVENVAAAVAAVKPYAVDVSSGVESAPGEKDPALVREFIRRVKNR